MIILGLGSNIGNRLAHLRLALERIQQLNHVKVIRVSPVYMSDAVLPEGAPSDWNMPYLNAAISCQTTLEPLELLKELKNIEHTIGRKPLKRHWGPRVIDIDILAWENRTIDTEMLTVPHVSLQERPFALWPLADIAPDWEFPLPGNNQHKSAAEISERWGSRFSGKAPFHTQQINQRIDTPRLIGILNITPDSFSDGGLYLLEENAYHQAQQLIVNGAEIIDIGAESTRPNAAYITPEIEWLRLESIVSIIIAKKHEFLIPPIISIDTRHPSTAKKALALGVDWINDQSGGENIEMQKCIANTNTDYVIMHQLGLPADKNQTISRSADPVEIIFRWATARINELINIGIKKEKIIFDPGIGFGKTAEQSMQILRRVNEFNPLGVRILIGHSRKSFLTLLTDKNAAERDIETLGLSMALATKSVDYLRVHNVDYHARALKIFKAFY